MFTNGRTGTPIELPIETYLGHSNDYSEEKTEQLQLTLNHQFAHGLGLIAQFGSNTTGREQGATGYMGTFGGPPTAQGDVRRFQFDQKRTSDGQYAALHLTWEGQTGAFAHKALVGVNASENEMFNINGFSIRSAPFAGPFVPGGVLPAATSVNIYNPVITAYPHLNNFDSSPPFAHLRWVYEDRGLNLQDLVSYAPWNMQVLLGLRYSKSDLSFDKDTLHSGARATRFTGSSADKWIPRVGVVWSATDTFDVFASYGESFNPQFNAAQGPNDTLLTDPETGEQFEAGMRFRPFDERLSIALSVYRLRKQNVVRPNPDVPNTSILDGEQQSRGIELDIAGSLTDAIEMYLSYAYIDTEILQAAREADNGARFTAIPRNKLVFWTEWDVWNGYSLAYGLDYQDEHNADLAGAAVVDGRTLHELRLRKTFSLASTDVSVEIAGRNLSDEVWYQNTTTPIFIKRGEPRNFTLTVRFDF